MYHSTWLDKRVQLGRNTGAFTRPMDSNKHDSAPWAHTVPAVAYNKGEDKGKVMSLSEPRQEKNENWRKETVHNSTNWRQKAGPLTDYHTQSTDTSAEYHNVPMIPAGIRPGWVWESPTTTVPGRLPRAERGEDRFNDILVGINTNKTSTKLFTPSHIVLGQPPVLTIENARKAVMSGMILNPNYRGALTDFHIDNASATASENCSVRLIGIHPNATIKEILQVVRTGKIYSVNRCDPEPGKTSTAAADVVFVKRAAAEAFVSGSMKGLMIRGERVSVSWNRNRVKEPTNIQEGDSRIVRIQGPANKLSIEILDDLFHQYFKYELVDARSWSPRHGLRIVEMTFESINPQAAWARRVLKQHFTMGLDGEFDFCHGRDPCDLVGALEEAPLQNRLALPWRRGVSIVGDYSLVSRQLAGLEWRENRDNSTRAKLLDRPWRQL